LFPRVPPPLVVFVTQFALWMTFAKFGWSSGSTSVSHTRNRPLLPPFPQYWECFKPLSVGAKPCISFFFSPRYLACGPWRPGLRLRGLPSFFSGGLKYFEVLRFGLFFFLGHTGFGTQHRSNSAWWRYPILFPPFPRWGLHSIFLTHKSHPPLWPTAPAFSVFRVLFYTVLASICQPPTQLLLFRASLTNSRFVHPLQTPSSSVAILVFGLGRACTYNHPNHPPTLWFVFRI